MRTRHAITALAVAALAVPSLGAAAVVPVDPGPMTRSTPVVGTMQNLPRITGTTYSAGPNMFPTVSAYYGSGQAATDQADVAAAARRWITSWTQANCGSATVVAIRRCRATVVFDIDDTLLNTYSYAAAQDPVLSFDPVTWDAYVAACGYAPITPTITLLNDLLARGVHVAIVSGGPAAIADSFLSCLRTNGVRGWSSATFRPASANGVPASRWKATQRADIHARGWRIIAAIGDQVSDMSYGHAMRGFLLPNTMTYLA